MLRLNIPFYDSSSPAMSHELMEDEAPDENVSPEEKLLRQAVLNLSEEKRQLKLLLEDLRQVHHFSRHFIAANGIESVLNETLEKALGVLNTDMGLILLYENEEDRLSVTATAGLGVDYLLSVEFLPRQIMVCGQCYNRGRPLIIEDVAVESDSIRYRELAREAGIRAVHCVPLVTSDGDTIGVLAGHFSEPHRPSTREMELVQLYAGCAADWAAAIRRREDSPSNKRAHLGR